MERKLLKRIYECRCNGRLQTKGFTLLTHWVQKWTGGPKKGRGPFLITRSVTHHTVHTTFFRCKWLVPCSSRNHSLNQHRAKVQKTTCRFKYTIKRASVHHCQTTEAHIYRVRTFEIPVVPSARNDNNRRGSTGALQDARKHYNPSRWR